ncbi:MAG: putative quinol monooxygenase [Bacteroidia bacterium]
MITRIVRMEFQADKVADFMNIFEESKTRIRNFEGCSHLTLFGDAANPNVRVTYSIWESEKALENYRNSELFRQTWAKTKVLFAQKPIAFSLQSLIEVE